MSITDASRHPELSAEGLARIGARNSCDRESIHLCGAIQPHGFLLAIDPTSLVVTAASTNVPRLASGYLDPLGITLGDLVGAETARVLLSVPATGNPHDSLPVRVSLAVEGAAGGRTYDVVLHARGPLTVLEFEDVEDTTGAQSARFFQRQRDAVKALLTLESVGEICRLTVQEVRKLTGYDRVMIYRFEPDAHGHVVAEARRNDLEPFLGLHYPASDIPRQARVLYMTNWIRVIVDADYEPVPIEALPDVAVDQIDLSLAVLRSVSPVHLAYLRNMGVAATMTISLIVDNQLWGMIACHHSTPKNVDHLQRLACEALGQLVSVRLRAAEASRDHALHRELSRMAAQVVSAMAASENPAAGAAAAPAALLGMTAADGAVVEVDGLRACVGRVPEPGVVDLLVPHLAALAGAGPAPLTVDSLPAGLVLPANADTSDATGAMYLPLPGRVQGFILWLRGERAQTVRWAGRPDAKPDDSAPPAVPLTPRASFDEWLEDVRGHSLPWLVGESAVATELAQAMPEVLLHRAQNRLVRLALHDPLTGLANRLLLHDQLDELLRPPGPATQRRDTAADERHVGVLFIDVDGFKAVNDTLGHSVGDELLTAAARRITEAIRPQDLVARMGGDEFVVLVASTDQREAVGVAQRIVEDFRRSFVLGGVARRSLTLSVGVAIVPIGTESADALHRADAAMYHAKRSGRDQVAVYDASLGTATSRQQLAGEELEAAISGRQITVHYQPIIDLRADGPPTLHGFEALARWQHPVRGIVPPDAFIGLAEETGLIHALGDSVMVQALRQLQAWPDRSLTMAVNVSVRQLVQPGFAGEVLSRLVELGVAPDRLCLEITESQMMEQPELALAVLSELRAADVRIGIDDFGTGFSSMAYLRDLPAAELKIDQLFVAGLPHDRKDVAVVTATVRLAHSLGMVTVAEGVETAEQLAYLREIGCDFAQGFLIGRPAPAATVALSRWAVRGRDLARSNGSS